MRRLFDWIKEQLSHLLPAFLFFFIAFNLLNITVGLRLGELTFGIYSFLNVLLGSVIVAKVMIVVDNLPWIDIFPKKPLIYNILWKTWIYGVGAFIFRILFHFFPEFSNRDLPVNADWLFFLVVQCWYFILFFIFVTLRELVNLIGVKKVKRSFFG